MTYGPIKRSSLINFAVEMMQTYAIPIIWVDIDENYIDHAGFTGLEVKTTIHYL